MLTVPMDSDPCVNLIGIDPGTTKLGVGLIRVDFLTRQIVSSDAFTLRGDWLVHGDWIPNIHGERYARIRALTETLVEIFIRSSAWRISSEAPFFNPRRPAAFEALVEILSGIRQAVHEYDPWQKLYTVDPSSVKNAVGAKGGSDKDIIKQSVLRLPDLHYQGTKPLAELDEHSIDALAVAYWSYLTTFR